MVIGLFWLHCTCVTSESILTFCSQWVRWSNVGGCYSSTTLYCQVLQRTTPVLRNTTTFYSSTTLYYKVLQRTTPVLQSTSAVLLRTTTYYSSTTPYYNVLLQYYSVLPSTTPVLVRTTKYFCSTTPYYNVLLQYYSVLQRTTPVLLRTTTYYSSTTLYYKVLLQYYSVLQSTTPVLVLTAQQLEEPGAAISQGEVFLTVDLGCPSFEYLWPRSLPRSYLVPDLVHFPFNKQRFPSNLHWIWSFGWKIEIYASDVRPIVFCTFLLINPRCFWTFFNHASPCCFELINW